jgi:hypothetical protein
MSLGICPDCWERQCVCGSQYKSWSKEDLIKQIKMLVKIYNKKSKSEKIKLKFLTSEAINDRERMAIDTE